MNQNVFQHFDEALSAHGMRLMCRDSLGGGVFDVVDFSRLPQNYADFLRMIDSGYFDLAKVSQMRRPTQADFYMKMWMHQKEISTKKMADRCDVWISCLRNEANSVHGRLCYDHRGEYREIW